MTKIYYDCEFNEDGYTIELISIGLVTEYGDEYYAIPREVNMARISRNQWLVDNVLPSLPLVDSDTSWPSLNISDPCVKPRYQIANEVRDFIVTKSKPELWAWYGAYDHVALCQLWGRMIDLPKGIPMWTNDIQQVISSNFFVQLDPIAVPPEQAKGHHNALEDARHNKVVLEWAQGYGLPSV